MTEFFHVIGLCPDHPFLLDPDARRQIGLFIRHTFDLAMSKRPKRLKRYTDDFYHQTIQSDLSHAWVWLKLYLHRRSPDWKARALALLPKRSAKKTPSGQHIIEFRESAQSRAVRDYEDGLLSYPEAVRIFHENDPDPMVRLGYRARRVLHRL